MKSVMYRLYELKDGLKGAIANIDKLLQEQKELCLTLETSSNASKFVDFVNQLKESWKNYESQKKSSETRLSILNELLTVYEKKDRDSQILDDLVAKILFVLGANPEPLEKSEETTN